MRLHNNAMLSLQPEMDIPIILGGIIIWIIIISVILVIMKNRTKKSQFEQPPREEKPLSDALEDLYREGILTEKEYSKLYQKIEYGETMMNSGNEQTTLQEKIESAKKLFDEGYLSYDNYQRLLKNLKKK